MGSAIGVGGVGLPSTSENSELSTSSNGVIRRARFANIANSFGSGADYDNSVVTFERSESARSFCHVRGQHKSTRSPAIL